MGYQRFAGLIACFLGIVLMMPPAMANTEELKSFKDWQVYKQETDQGRICFMSSVPKSCVVIMIEPIAARHEYLSRMGLARQSEGLYLFWLAIAIKNSRKLILPSIKRRINYLLWITGPGRRGQKMISVWLLR